MWDFIHLVRIKKNVPTRPGFRLPRLWSEIIDRSAKQGQERKKERSIVDKLLITLLDFQRYSFRSNLQFFQCFRVFWAGYVGLGRCSHTTSRYLASSTIASLSIRSTSMLTQSNSSVTTPVTLYTAFPRKGCCLRGKEFKRRAEGKSEYLTPPDCRIAPRLRAPKGTKGMTYSL